MDRAISNHVAAHPGPIGGVRSTRVSFFMHEYPLQHLGAALADKGVKVFIVFNRLDMPVSMLFSSHAAALLSTPNIKHKVDAPTKCDGNKSLYLVFVGVVFLSILDCF
jgi:hypothetical protein